MAICSKYKLTT